MKKRIISILLILVFVTFYISAYGKYGGITLINIIWDMVRLEQNIVGQLRICQLMKFIMIAGTLFIMIIHFLLHNHLAVNFQNVKVAFYGMH